MKKVVTNQFVFQKEKSVTDCNFVLHSIISKVLTAGKTLDYEKCFDKIERSLLWQKLLAQNVSCKLVNAIKSMYAIVRSCFRYKSTLSNCINSEIGLKQGGPSSTILFLLFVNDISDNIDTCTDLPDIFTINELKVFLIMYADDQAVFATSLLTLQHILKRLGP